MPKRPKTPCKHPSCARLVPYGSQYCSDHIPMHRKDVKGTTEKGYDSRWRKARAWFLNAHPLCVMCLENERLEQATVVDHIVPHRGDQILFWDESNWQPLCKKCHDRKTRTEDQHLEYKF